MSSAEKELLEFLSCSCRADLKFLAVKHFNGLSGTMEGRKFIVKEQIYVDRLIELTGDNVVNVVKEALSCLINIAGDEPGVRRMLDSSQSANFCLTLLENVIHKDCGFADPIAMLLSNMTRTESGVKVYADILSDSSASVSVDKLMKVLCSVNHNPNALLDFLAPFLANLSRVEIVRRYFLNPEAQALKQLLPFTQHPSDIRRQAASTIIKNICFETEVHQWLLDPSTNLLPSLLLPLAGPEEFDDDDMEKLPTELQYLEPDKQREPIALVRANLVEALTQLCATSYGRECMRKNNVYVIMREYHKWEKEAENERVIMNLIDILIADEPAEHLGSNLKEIDVPDHLQKQFDEEEKAE